MSNIMKTKYKYHTMF